MRRALLMLLLGLAAADARAQQPACVRDGAQAELVACAGEDAAAADLDMNAVYGALVHCAARDTLFLRRLRESQRLWIRFRDAEVEAYQPVDEAAGEIARFKWGSMYPLTYLTVKEHLTRERTDQLRRFFTEAFLDDDCGGSPFAHTNEQPHAEDR